MDGSRRFGTKLWNATRFALSNGATTAVPVPDRAELTDADRWILDGLDRLVSEVDADFDAFEFAQLAESLYHFTWDEVCDWYVELAKVQIAEGGARADATRAVLGHVLDVLLRLLHPLMPFVTERLWTTLTGGESLVIAQWPAVSGSRAGPGCDRTDRRAARSWSPRSAGSAATRASRRAGRCRPSCSAEPHGPARP